MSDSPARWAAEEFYGTSTLFKDLAVGQRFGFQKDVDPPFIKTRSGYKREHGPGKYRTGQRTAVFPGSMAI